VFDLDSLPVLTEDGRFVSEKHMRVAEIIRDYDPNLEIEWIPEDKRAAQDPPFRVVHTNPTTGYRYVVCYADNLDGPLLERIYKMDAEKHGNILSDVDAHNQAVKALIKKKMEDEMAEANDLAASILRSPKSVYRHNGVKYQ
jgi:hypothetical protein